MHATQATLRAAFARWGLGEPAGKPWQEAREFLRDRSVAEEALRLAAEVGVVRAAEELGTTRRTLHRAWDRWGLGRPTDRPEVATATRARLSAATVASNQARTVPPDHPWRRAAAVQVAERSMAAAG